MENETVNQLLAKAIAADAMPGAVYLTGTRETVLAEEALGHLDYDAETSSVTLDTIYDLASLTKTIVTTPLAMLLYEQGQLDLEAPVNTYIPLRDSRGPEWCPEEDSNFHDLAVTGT